MAIYLTNAEVRSLLPMRRCIQAVEKVFVDEAAGGTANLPRQHLPLPKGFHRTVAGVARGLGVYGMKTYGGGVGNRTRYLVLLYGVEDATLHAIMEARDIGQIRTGAVSAVATKYMARPEAETLGIIGSGWEARAQLEAISLVRSLSHVKVYSRSPENREGYAAEMREKLGLDVTPVSSAEEATRDVDILVTITGSNEPVLEGSWIADGTHVNGVGATGRDRRELDEEAVRRAALVAVENMAQAKNDCGDLLYAEDHGAFDWERAVELKDIVTGAISGRPDGNAVTLFDSLGVATEDLAAASFVLESAREQGVGTELPL